MNQILIECEQARIARSGRFVSAALHGPHQVLSTSTHGGGLRSDVSHLLNHQSCEAADHKERFDILHTQDHEGYHRHVCQEAGLDPEHTSMMGTAANMQYAAAIQEKYEYLCVTAIATAGVQGNACRAGDPATWMETPDGWSKIPTMTGTINIMMLIGVPLHPGALVRAASVMNEGKVAALMDLAIASRYSGALATGTGTDQFALACPLDSTRHSHAHASPHTKLGELIGRAAKRAVSEALRWQNGLEESMTRSLLHAFARFGLDEKKLRDSLRRHLDERAFEFAEKNWKSLIYEPQVAASAYALAAILDRMRCGTLPESAAREAFVQHASGLAAGLAAKNSNFSEFVDKLSREAFNPPEIVALALAMGWQAKWA